MNLQLPESVQNKKVFVGLSGGVDSAVTAALLQKAGADVTGVFIKGWYPPGMPCTWAADRRDAMRVAAHLGIPFHTLDAADAYKRGVIDYLLREYAVGRTPNPDIMCNREVKFGVFYQFAREHGADFIATGHYAQRVGTGSEAQLLRGVDPAKDQSYFLWAIPKEALAHTLFPLGSMEKADTRKLAQAYGLPVADKRDSQGICFLGSISIEDFLRHEINPEPGIARTEAGEAIGQHEGAVLYTLGERIALSSAPAGPWYVLRKDMLKNELVVGKAPVAPGDTSKTIALTETNWFSTPSKPLYAQYRYHGPTVEGMLHSNGSAFEASAPIPEPLAAGQSLVLYDGTVCLGGGIIA